MTPEKYDELYHLSRTNPDAFWAHEAKRLNWIKSFTKINNSNFTGDVSIKWFEDGTLNASVNCLDRHLPEKANHPAIIWEANDPGQHQTITYAQAHEQTCRLANLLKSRGVKKGDRVTIYMPNIPAAVFAMLACARIGAVHSVVFGGFSPDALRGRILDCKSNIVITADEGLRGTKTIPLKNNVDQAINGLDVHTVITYRRTGGKVNMQQGRDLYYQDEVTKQDTHCPPEEMNAEDPLFILYTSGSTGKPKGVLHTTGGYMVYAALTHEVIFNVQPNEIYFCTADVGWITGHSYIVYGPLANGTTSLLFEGIPTHPDQSRFWQIVDDHQVNIFYTAPTAIRALQRDGDDFVTKTKRTSLRILGTVGEPINAEAWHWYHDVVGNKKCPIVDTWWQTETGGIMISPIPNIHAQKPGFATKPFFGIDPAIVDDQGKILTGTTQGKLCITKSWPGQARTVYGDHQRFIDTYFTTFPGKYFTGDGCKRDDDGDYRITGRVDDVMNISGHRLGTAEVENALDEHEHVAEAAVVGYPHDIKGQGIYAFVTLKTGVQPTNDIKQQLIDLVVREIGAIAKPDKIQFAPALPKTRSGKIMRRILRKIACGEEDQLGDVSTLADPSVVDDLIKNKAA